MMCHNAAIANGGTPAELIESALVAGFVTALKLRRTATERLIVLSVSEQMCAEHRTMFLRAIASVE